MADHDIDRAEFDRLLLPFLPFLEPGETLTEDADLRDLGLDSLNAVELLARLENHFGVRFVDDALRLETFATPRRLWSVLGSLRTPVS
ncbi:acyl carrier protein [Actinoplanes sp. NPDC051343]|jgi:acyl carrier protein|uniref:acyl carrier protein n=1 Tax=Actinoplanes sp. NPDC051343 TaxID=3363906 RepID=UPI003790A52B